MYRSDLILIKGRTHSMRKIRLFIASSLDGYIAKTSGDIDWLFTDADYGYTEFLDSIDTVIMGGKTYRQVLEFGEYPYKSKKSFVFSKTMQGKNDDVEFVGEDITNFINKLRNDSGGDIWLVGGGEIIQYFIKDRLLDELILSIHPIILGDGIPLIVKDASLETKLELKEVKTFDSGLLQVSYDLKP
jgi:dihydrofolate reductase